MENEQNQTGEIITPWRDEAPVKQPKKKWPMIALIAVIVLALIGVGVYLLISRWMVKTDESAEVETEVSQVEKPSTPQTIKEPETEPEETEPTEEPEDDARYIVVETWGKKIKVPDELSVNYYTYDQQTLRVWGTKIGGGEGIPVFADPERNKDGLAGVSRFPVEGNIVGCGGSGIFTEYGRKYCLATPHYSISAVQDDVDQATVQWEIDSMQLMKEMFSADNYLDL